MNALQFVAPVLLVADLTRSLAYYQQQLGFSIDFVDEDSYAGVLRDGCCIHLKSSDVRARTLHVGEGDDDDIHAFFRVADASALAAEFAAAGATISRPLRQAPYGKEFYVKDPDGYSLAFVEVED